MRILNCHLENIEQCIQSVKEIWAETFKRNIIVCLMLAVFFVSTSSVALARDATDSLQSKPLLWKTLEYSLPNDAERFVHWCGESADTLVIFGKKATYFVNVGDTSQNEVMALLTDLHPNFHSFSCTDNGKWAFFTDQGRTNLFFIDMVTRRVTTLVKGKHELVNATLGHVVSGKATYVVGTSEFPDKIELPNGHSMEVIKGLIPENRQQWAASIAWTSDEQQLVVYFSNENRLLVYQPKDNARIERKLTIPEVYPNFVTPDSSKPSEVFIQALDSTEAFSSLYRWSYLHSDTQPKLCIGEFVNESISMSRDTFVFSRDLFRTTQRRFPNDNFAMPYATEIYEYYNGVPTKLATLGPNNSSVIPEISRNGNGIAYVKYIDDKNIADTNMNAEKKLVVLLKR